MKRRLSQPVQHSRDDVQAYVRKPLSNYEGYKRLALSLEKLELKERSREKLCEVCGRRTKAWRAVPATFGKPMGVTKASLNSKALQGKFVIACDGGPDGCAAMLVRSGVQAEAIREQQAIERLGLVLPRGWS